MAGGPPPRGPPEGPGGPPEKRPLPTPGEWSPPGAAISPALAQKLRVSLSDLGDEKKLLIAVSQRFMNVVSLFVICSVDHGDSSSVLFLSVDRPNSYISRMVDRYCASRSRMVYQDFTMMPRGEVSHVRGLFAPKLLLETLDHLVRSQGRGVSVVVSNLSALTFYNSNDRIKEFLKMLDAKVGEGTIRKLTVIMDKERQYIYNEAKTLAGRTVEIGW